MFSHRCGALLLGFTVGAFKHAFTKAAYFQQLAEYIPGFKTPSEYRLNTESSIVAPLSSHAGIKIGYVVRFADRRRISARRIAC